MASSAPSARYGVPCPRCKAAADEPCRAASGRVTDTHIARIDASVDRLYGRTRTPGG